MKKGTKVRKKVVLEEIRGIYYIKEAHYSIGSWWAGKEIDSGTKEYVQEMVIVLNYKVVGGEENVRSSG